MNATEALREMREDIRAGRMAFFSFDKLPFPCEARNAVVEILEHVFYCDGKSERQLWETFEAVPAAEAIRGLTVAINKSKERQ